ncbi:MAG: lysoplasmalogenase [Terriglobia bacterium]
MWSNWQTLGRWPAFDPTGRLLLWISMGSSFIFFLSLGWQPYSGSVVIKAMSILPLALLAFRLLHSREGFVLGFSLLFSSLGDVFLAIDPVRLFVFGLASFLIAHLMYIALFAQSWARPLRINSTRLVMIVLVVLYGVLMAHWFLPFLGNLTGPVLAYLGVIILMVVAALGADFSRSWVAIGAVLFLLSDSLIAVSKFKQPVLFRDYLVWISYYLAQYFISVGFLREKLGPGDH